MRHLLTALLSIAASMLVLETNQSLASTAMQTQSSEVPGKYVYKTYREGKGGHVNEIEITAQSGGRFHISFSGTYFYLAGKAETFHEGSGEGDGQLTSNVLTANLSDGAGGSRRATLTFGLGQVTVQTGRTCQINVDPNGVYRKEVVKRAGPPRRPAVVAVPKSRGLEVCPDPAVPCNSRAHKFANFELSFKLPAVLRRGQTYTSTPFYAVIVKTYDDEACDADDHTASIESERLRIQKIYPTRKVFGSYSCPNMDAVEYDFPGKLDVSGERVAIMIYLAVYAGGSDAEAKQFLTYVRTIYPQALLKRMTASYELIDQ